MHGAHLWPPPVDVHVACALCQLVRGARVVGEGGDQLRLHATVVHEVAQPGGQHPRLARPGRCQHARGTGRMRDGRALLAAEPLLRRRVTFDVEPAGELDALTVDAQRPAAARAVAVLRPAVHGPARATVDPRRSAVGQQYVRAVRRRRDAASETLRMHRRPPHRFARACVDEVGTEQERELVVQQAMIRTERPQGAPFALGREDAWPGQRRVDDHDARSARRPVAAQRLDGGGQRGPVAHCLPADAVHRCIAPGTGHVTLGVHEDPPTEQRARPVRPEGRGEVQAAGSAS